jgi:hypothetical protein
MGCLLILLCSVCCAWPIVAVLSSSRNAEQCRVCERNLEMIALALQFYEARWGCLPPAYLADDRGKPMHSWRVLLLPELQESGLYQQYDFSEPWNGPNNRLLGPCIPGVYRCPFNNRDIHCEEAAYVAVTGPDTMWPGAEGRKAAEIKDGWPGTLALAEAPDAGIHWMEPRDITAEAFLRRHTSGNATAACRAHYRDEFLHYSWGWNVAFADCRVRSLSESSPKEALSALLTVDGGEPVLPDSERLAPRKHSRIVAGILFLFLCALPVVRLRRRPVAGN